MPLSIRMVAVVKYPLALSALIALSITSVFVGVTDISPGDLFSSLSGRAWLILGEVRIPRTIALNFGGAGMAMAGTVMQLISRNRFVEPSTAGTVESTGLGLIVVLLVAPGLPVYGKMLVAAGFATAGTSLFLFLLTRVPLKSRVMVPLIGIMLGGIINAVATFIAYRFNMLQSIVVWTTADFSAVLRGRYELLWLSFALTVSVYFAADHFTVVGMGDAFAKNLGVRHGRILFLGVLIVSFVTASVVVTAGMVPYVGLIVPNVVAMIFGDNLRRSLPWIAMCGAALVLACDIIGRLVIAPFEIPAGTILGILGSLFFLYLVLKGQSRDA